MKKQCKICKRIFPLQEFHLDKGLLDGHRNICKECAIRKAKDSRCRKMEKTDGLSEVLHSMKARCYNPKHHSYKRYGERGIDICQEWLANENQFYDWCRRHGYARGLQLDRIDNNRGYSPENCRFVTPSENQRNSSKCPYCEKEVAVIRRAYRLGAITQTSLAKFYGVTPSTISKICSKKVWKELEQCPSN